MYGVGNMAGCDVPVASAIPQGPFLVLFADQNLFSLAVSS